MINVSIFTCCTLSVVFNFFHFQVECWLSLRSGAAGWRRILIRFGGKCADFLHPVARAFLSGLDLNRATGCAAGEGAALRTVHLQIIVWNIIFRAGILDSQAVCGAATCGWGAGGCRLCWCFSGDRLNCLHYHNGRGGKDWLCRLGAWGWCLRSMVMRTVRSWNVIRSQGGSR